MTMVGIPGYVLSTSANPSGGIPNTRIPNVVVVGQVTDNTGSGPKYQPGGVVVIQSTASVINQVVSTAGTGTASFIYIPVVAATLVSSSNGFQSTAPPYTGCGAAMVWNDGAKRLEIWSSGTGAWLAQPAASAFTCSS
jgi:hypothetical protein